MDKAFRLCACMGPQGDDPFCPCVMDQKGLKATGPSEQDIAAFEAALSQYEEDNE